jgi:hypothetical protein
MMPSTRPVPADHEIHQNQKTRMKRRVVGALTVVALVYFFLLFPQQLLENIRLSVTSPSAQWLATVLGAAGNVTFAWILSFVLFASDSAFRGSGKSAIWARAHFASRAAIEQFNCSDGEASALWFKFFDTWGIARSPNFNLMINSYSATYAARAVFYLQRTLLVFLFISIISIVVHWAVFHSYAGRDGGTTLAVHMLVVLLFAASFTFITLTNRLPTDSRDATGCWARVQDIFARSRTVFVQDVLQHAASLEAAFRRVDQIRDQLLSDRQAADSGTPASRVD